MQNWKKIAIGSVFGLGLALGAAGTAAAAGNDDMQDQAIRGKHRVCDDDGNNCHWVVRTIHHQRRTNNADEDNNANYTTDSNRSDSDRSDNDVQDQAIRSKYRSCDQDQDRCQWRVRTIHHRRRYNDNDNTRNTNYTAPQDQDQNQNNENRNTTPDQDNTDRDQNNPH
ncbi:MAG: hypothetical protein KGJ78_08865 [Alphaproteobacteria bacterium]|nr:hypothetical protein [Alphaproteobacteria bacterium]